jgi:type IV pilus assembly protein PilY1
MKRHLLLPTVTLLIACVCGHAFADDTEIYGTVTLPSVEPNVLVIFDTSGSMGTVDVPGDPYSAAQTYGGPYPNRAVYSRGAYNYQTQDYDWDLFANDVNSLNCADIKSALLSVGYAEGKIRGAPNYTCGSSSRRLRMGNFMNYDASGVGVTRSRISVAKDVLSDLINTTTGVRFGMFVFNFEQGGRLAAACGTPKDTLLGAISSATASGWTPLAETLAEAGLYFAGQPSWFNSGVTYTSPMQQRCQKNYIIIMTDGEPTKDRDSRLYSAPYINGDVIGDYDRDHGGGLEFDSYPSDGSDYLDDVAKYLYENDCNPAMGDGTAFDKQNITTFTIGFKLKHKLLQDTAANGGGEYFTADNYSELSEAFQSIMSNIMEANACFVAPVVPISRMNRTFAGEKIYLGFFKPQQSGSWIGNVKRYGLKSDGTLVDNKRPYPGGDPVTTADGLIKDNALSWWTTLGFDGPAVEKGGAAEALRLFIDAGGNRKVYTHTGTQALLTHAANAFVSTNTAITNVMLGVSTDTERLNVFSSVRQGEFGDIIHSEPAVVEYDAKTVIYVGANDGLLHAIDDATGAELWSFVPPEHLGRLKRLNDADHDYFVDGSPVVYHGSSQKILIIGSRRGGEHYTALDVTNYSDPRFLYQIGPNFFDPNPANNPDTDSYERLGQSWARPERVTVATGSSVTPTGCSLDYAVTSTEVFLMAGGYDNNQDLDTPNAADGVGRAVFAVDMTTGQLLNSLRFTPATHPGLGMTHSVIDVSGFDHDGDGIVSRIYFGDLGGQLFALRDDEVQNYTVCSRTVAKSVVDGTWTGRKLFNASADGVHRKILYAPDAVAEKFPSGVQGEYLYFGTGDRENPGETAVVNRFYAVKNDWTTNGVLTESGLVDLTANLIQLGTDAQKQAVRTALDNAKGWFIRLENPGEKVVASPRVYGGVAYFTTYTPSSGFVPDPTDPCAVSTVRGVARLYALNYKTGAAVHEFSAEAETDNSGKAVTLGKKDRSLALGTAIPSAPVIAIIGGAARIFVGVEGGIVSLPAVATQDLYRYFWNQVF